MDKAINTVVWKKCPLAPELINVSSNGDIKILSRLVVRKDGVRYYSKEKILRAKPNNHTGYIHVSIPFISERLAHRIVAITFLENPLNKSQVHHKNNNRSDNRVDNLQWVDNSENQKFSFLFGNGDNKGDRCPAAKISFKDVTDIRNRFKNESVSKAELGRQYNLSRTSICDIISRKTWKNDSYNPKRPPKKYKSLILPITNLSGETWHSIPGVLNYQISNFDRIKSLLRLVCRGGKNMVIRERIMAQQIDSSGYIVAHINDNGSRSTLFIHRVKAIIFIPNPNKLPVVNHIDGNKLNNELFNLEWCTHKLNAKHAYDIGLNISRKGVAHHNCKLTEESVRDIRARYKPRVYTKPMLAKEYLVSKSTISDIISGRNWKSLV